ncbi:hypothetical protein AQUCO_10100008v1 [Aquilegia coerulea]|uniref:Phospho-2-dehydro-3-deoxyheptonate aldolase n=1 Tax=Aquilegia coerulea TaxID=218851 RepID=A0A2G5C3Y4_AQUCA|nr:hypothetical protein AQUCO_10100008v1 [Aquilegia coerulea]
MALTSSSVVSTKSLLQSKTLLPSSSSSSTKPNNHSSFSLLPTNYSRSIIKPISAIHAAEAAKSTNTKSSATPVPTTTTTTTPGKWSIDSWRTKKALQLPEYPNQQDLETVLQTLEAFPPIVFAGEARKLTSCSARLV